jgi:hypothetical protein
MAEKAATLEAAEEAVGEVMAEAVEAGEATAVVEAALGAVGMIAVTTVTADRTETVGRHLSKKVKKSMSP